MTTFNEAMLDNFANTVKLNNEDRYQLVYYSGDHYVLDHESNMSFKLGYNKAAQATAFKNGLTNGQTTAEMISELKLDENTQWSREDYVAWILKYGVRNWRGQIVSTAREMISRSRAVNEAEQKLTDLWAALEQEAEERDWCEDYDDFAREHGGPSRDREYLVTVRVTAKKNASSSDLEDVIYGMDHSDLEDAIEEYTEYED